MGSCEITPKYIQSNGTKSSAMGHDDQAGNKLQSNREGVADELVNEEERNNHDHWTRPFPR